MYRIAILNDRMWVDLKTGPVFATASTAEDWMDVMEFNLIAPCEDWFVYDWATGTIEMPNEVGVKDE